MKGNRKFRSLLSEQHGAAGGAAGFIMLYITIFIGTLFGLYLTPEMASACTTASWAFNESDYETIFDIICIFVLPILWIVLMMMGLSGAVYGVWRISSRL